MKMKQSPEMDGNVSKVRTEMRFQGREESTTLIVVGNLFLWYIEVIAFGEQRQIHDLRRRYSFGTRDQA